MHFMPLPDHRSFGGEKEIGMIAHSLSSVKLATLRSFLSGVMTLSWNRMFKYNLGWSSGLSESAPSNYLSFISAFALKSNNLMLSVTLFSLLIIRATRMRKEHSDVPLMMRSFSRLSRSFAWPFSKSSR